MKTRWKPSLNGAQKWWRQLQLQWKWGGQTYRRTGNGKGSGIGEGDDDGEADDDAVGHGPHLGRQQLGRDDPDEGAVAAVAEQDDAENSEDGHPAGHRR